MFRIKICGITNIDDAYAAVAEGADAIGVNFYDKSPRYVTPIAANKITNDLDGLAVCFGVFVNKSAEEVQGIFEVSAIDGVQLHGDEPSGTVVALVQWLRKLPGNAPRPWARPNPRLERELNPALVIRARRLDDRGLSAVRIDLDACRGEGGVPGAVLVDSLTSGQYGGTGETVPWVGLADHRRWLGGTPLILAGGLTPDNVAEAIRIVRPHGVDVASGVESAPGRKDPIKVRDFIAAARAALDD